MRWLDDWMDRLGLGEWAEPEEAGPLRSSEAYQVTATARLSIMLSRPSAFHEAADIADQLRKRITLIVNIEGLDPEVSRRILDFLSGVIYAMDGRMSRVAKGTYLLSPSGLDLECGDLADLGLGVDGWEHSAL